MFAKIFATMATNPKGENETKSVSMPPDLLAAATERANKLRISNFSAYVRKLIEQDLATRGGLVFQETDSPPMPPAKPVNYRKRK